MAAALSPALCRISRHLPPPPSPPIRRSRPRSLPRLADAGLTWTPSTPIPNVYATAIDCVPAANACWATVLDILQESSVAMVSMN
jgi:hypothetical protein